MKSLVRSACQDDAVSIFHLIQDAVKRGLLQKRTLEDVRQAIGRFRVVEAEGHRVVCLSMERYSKRMWELRSFALVPGWEVYLPQIFELLKGAILEAKNHHVEKLMVVAGNGQEGLFEFLGFATATEHERLALFASPSQFRGLKWDPRVCRAVKNDAQGIFELVRAEAALGNLLPRPISEIRDLIRCARVVKESGQVVACAFYERYHAALGELRSLVVAQEQRGRGFAKILVESVLIDARGDVFELMAITSGAKGLLESMGFAKTASHGATGLFLKPAHWKAKDHKINRLQT